MKLIKIILIALVAVVVIFFLSAVVTGIIKGATGDTPAESVQKVLDQAAD